MKHYTRLGEQDCTAVIIADDTNELICIGYRRSLIKTVIFAFFSLVTCGFLLLLRRWRPRWLIGCQFDKSSVETADLLLVSDSSGKYELCNILELACEQIPDEFQGFIDDKSSLIDTESNNRLRRGNFLTYCLRYFAYRHDKFLWHRPSRKFVRLNGVGDDRSKCVDISLKYRGWDIDEQRKRLTLFGENCIHVEVKSYWTLLIHEVLNPFYVFQIASLTLWAVDNYFIYAGCIFFISVVSIVVELLEIRRQSEALRDTVSSANNTNVTVRRKNGDVENISSGLLTPGDIILIPSDGCLMACDALLLNGSCIVNESMLTGESTPVTKCALSKSEENETFSYDIHKKHVLFCGTSVVQTRFYGGGKVAALVLRTGFSTAKGELVKDILYPKPVSFKFYRDAMFFIGLLSIVALAGTIYSIYVFVKRGADLQKIIIRGLDIITIVVPPALPAAMTVGIWYAQRRLRRKEIFCISPPRINVCGKVNLVCFDKTGTLTEEGLQLHGVLPTSDGAFGDYVTQPWELPHCPLISCMSCCHTLTIINEKISGDPLDIVMFEATKWDLTEPVFEETAQFDVMAPTIVRPPGAAEDAAAEAVDIFKFPEELDVESIQMKTLVKRRRKVVDNCEEDRQPLEIGILRQFPFSSHLQRSAVVVRHLGSPSMEVYVKGAPETIVSLCKSSCIPSNFHEVLEEQTKKGHRVIALAFRKLDKKILWHHLQRMKREDLEYELELVGLLIMQNKLKSESAPVIAELSNARILTVMATGDNLMTALSVASECNMLSPTDVVQIVNVENCQTGKTRTSLELKSFSVATGGDEFSCGEYQNHNVQVNIEKRARYAMTGNSFSNLKEYFPEIFEKIILNGVVFARMSPHQKSQLIRTYQDLGFIVGMCGDGANDCGALKVAHAGISLSDTEASVASPFTSRIQNVKCVPIVIKEGRCALVTSFGVFKYMAIYSLIQFISVLILYSVRTNLGDYMFLFIDLFIITTVAFLMGRNEASDVLVARRPSGSLLSIRIILSLIVHLLILVCFQVGALFYVIGRPWYTPKHPKANEDVFVCWETTTIFFVTSYQYLIMAFVFSDGAPYRQPIYKNHWFIFALSILTVVVSLLVVFPNSVFHTFLQLEIVGADMWRYKVTLILLAILNLIICSCFEAYVINSEFLRSVKKFICRNRTKSRYKTISNSDFDIPS